MVKKSNMTLKEAEIEIDYFVDEFFTKNLFGLKNEKIQEGAVKGCSYFRELKKAGRNGQGFSLWLEKWEKWSYCLSVYFTKKTFDKYFPDYERTDYYRKACWDCGCDNVKEPSPNELTFQYCEGEYYLSLYIKEGSERESIKKFFDHPEIRRVCHFSDDKITERLQQSWARVGQGKYRDDMLELWQNACSVTGCSIKEVLVASHAKPWRDCNLDEKTDSHNGLLLSANLDALFDKFLITFDKNWKIKIAAGLEEDCRKMGITKDMIVNYEILDEIDRKKVQFFLEEHRNRFKKKEINRT
ncbi:MAG: HNH endonuclease [Treponema sp.]|jgi:hypothetical protein|nr:HNH endonuclease [Treponema sp.]